jgi:hypothetical protein
MQIKMDTIDANDKTVNLEQESKVVIRFQISDGASGYSHYMQIEPSATDLARHFPGFPKFIKENKNGHEFARNLDFLFFNNPRYWKDKVSFIGRTGNVIHRDLSDDAFASIIREQSTQFYNSGAPVVKTTSVFACEVDQKGNSLVE